MTPPGIAQNVNRNAGIWYQQTRYGNLFHAATALAGVTLATTGATAQTLGLWNPASSGKEYVMVRAQVGIVGASMTVSSLAWTFLINAGDGAAGTSAITTFTAGPTINGGYLGANQASTRAKFGTTITLAVAPTILRYFGVSFGSVLATTPAAYTLVDDFQNDVILAPGSVLMLSGSTGVGGALNGSFSWFEQPVTNF